MAEQINYVELPSDNVKYRVMTRLFPDDNQDSVLAHLQKLGFVVEAQEVVDGFVDFIVSISRQDLILSGYLLLEHKDIEEVSEIV